MHYRIKSTGTERFCPFRAKAARHYKYPGRCPGLAALWPFRPWADGFLPRLMSGELSVDGLKGQFAVSPGQRPGAKEHVSNNTAL